MNSRDSSWPTRFPPLLFTPSLYYVCCQIFPERGVGEVVSGGEILSDGFFQLGHNCVATAML